MQRTFVIADIHGAIEGLKQVFDRSQFNRKQDRLICLGDICDRRTGVKECVEELLTVKHLVMIMGNHDYWALQWMQKLRDGESREVDRHNQNIPASKWLLSEEGVSWMNQGGRDTLESYADGVEESHYRLFSHAKYYHLEHARLFVHGGIRPGIPLEEQDPGTFLWDRKLVEEAVTSKDQTRRITSFDAVYVGHTPTIRMQLQDSGAMDSGEDRLSNTTPHLCNPRPSTMRSPGKENNTTMGSKQPNYRWHDFPAKQCNVYLMDTGAGWPNGRLSMMDVDTCEVWQSDPLP